MAEYTGWSPIAPDSTIAYDPIDPLSSPNKQEINTDLRYMIYPGDPDLPTEDGDLRRIWDQVDRGLSERESLVFIGYSMPDYDSFAAGCFSRFANKRAIEVYTPSSEHIQRYRGLFGDSAACRQLTFESCRYGMVPGSRLW